MINLLFLGSGDFPAPIIEKLNTSKNLKIIALVTSIKEGEKDESAEMANKLQIPVIRTSSINKDFENIFEKYPPDIILVCNFGQLISEKIYTFPKYSTLNIHASILPKLRGACPIESAILQGLETTGISIQKIVEKMDAGDIIFQKEIQIEENETGGTLRKKLMNLTVENINQVLIDWTSGNINPIEQNENEATFCYEKDISKEKSKINWENSSVEIHRQIRAFDPKPGAWTNINILNNKKRIKLFSPEIVKDNLNLKSGEIRIYENNLLFGTIDNPIKINAVQLEGKNRMKAEEFLNGYRSKIQISN